ncbi:TetR/AcrR family transcriptional regulator [Faucicola atlantae]|uniref:TetR/AcrR family transcriptional regulator n=1 Tax=Faucicola atlantae TaxID=34059 RepID=UPI0025AFD11B|nr:TetR/AcrR family transcriptional regulator [Moraxella atlantae]
MTNAYDEKIDNIRADSELARKLVPNKFKFTSQQGRARRQKLLAAAKSLSADRPISEITLADVCEEAGIPRASAYHFFPNVDAVFLALRYLNSTEIFKTLATVSAADTQGWQAYITNYVYTYVDVLRDDSTVARLVYETNTPAFENNEFGSEVQ